MERFGACKNDGDRPRMTHMLRKSEKGQALTEFIIVFPLFLLLLLGVVQLALITMAQQVVHYAAFAATRAAVVRPCMAFHPNHANDPGFTPTVFAAAVLSTLAVAPSQNLGLPFPYDWLPMLPASPEVRGLNFTGDNPMAAENQYTNAAYLTSVVRVRPTNLNANPPVWKAYGDTPGPGTPCLHSNGRQEKTPGQNVPPTGFDLTLDVIFLFPMRVPLVNRVFFGVFVNFSTVAQSMGMQEIGADVGPYNKRDVMIYPTRTVLPHEAFMAAEHMEDMLDYREFRFPNESRNAGLGEIFFNNRRWYPIPIRGRCTLQVEGAAYPLVFF